MKALGAICVLPTGARGANKTKKNMEMILFSATVRDRSLLGNDALKI